MRVSVIIPTHNEAEAIGRVLADIPLDLATEVIVVDSNSTDATVDVARSTGARVVLEPRRGYGRACLTGIANTNRPDVLVFLDGDYSDRPAELPILLSPIMENRADITLGSRFSKGNSGALPWHQAFGNHLAAGLIRLLYGVKITDLGPFRAARAEVVRALALQEATYGWAVEMILKGARAGFRIVEVPVSYHPRIGKSKISGTFKGTVGATWFILSRIVRYYFRRPKMNKATFSTFGQSRLMKLPKQTDAPLVTDRRVLVIMAKAPKAGLVKTRLMTSIPPSAVIELYGCLLQDTVALAKSLTDVKVVIVCPESDEQELAKFVGEELEVVTQEGQGLAAALTSVFQRFTAAGQHAIAFNSDSPHLAPSVLSNAFEVLAANDVVIGPTEDGGYYLIGAKASHPRLFENDGLGTSSALERLLARTKELGLSTGFTETFYDVDVADDLLLLEKELRLAPAKAPKTAAWFRDREHVMAPLRKRSEQL